MHRKLNIRIVNSFKWATNLVYLEESYIRIKIQNYFKEYKLIQFWQDHYLVTAEKQGPSESRANCAFYQLK